MKKLFTIDDFMVAAIAALGYGFGETIAQLSGWPELMCVMACFALGIASEQIISKIVFSKTVQKSMANRIFTYVSIVLVFLAGQYVSVRWMGVSMMEYLVSTTLSTGQSMLEQAAAIITNIRYSSFLISSPLFDSRYVHWMNG